MARIDSFFRLVVEQRASDLHLCAGYAPTVRLNGELVPLPFRALSDLEARRLILEILTDAQRHTVEADKDLDVVYDLEGQARFRGNVFFHKHGIGAVFRVIPRRIPLVEELDLPPAIRNFTRLTNGLVLVTGPTGSGKTTTLAALIHEINRFQQRHIITIEDPIEFIHVAVKSLVTHREVGSHAETFAGALRAALREAPDVIVVGELRDLESVSLALSAAETGVLVFATLHTNSAAKSIHRLIDLVPESSRDHMRGMISVLLRGVVAQRLCRRRGGEGRIAAIELLLHDYAVANMIREDKLHQLEAHLQSASPETSGMQSLDRCLLDYVRRRLVEPSEAIKAANYPEMLGSALAALPKELD
ncbi:MAG TPA: PilT/PilU family type 4a pilus ATPase [Vicinamibacteria bacterium]|nr:PilT/PilU family type 4a pilus ATPase [Vicinamibacteria bacterium]